MIKKEIAEKLFKAELSEQRVEFALVDKIEARYKSLGSADIGRYLSQIQKMSADLKSSIDKVGNLLEDADKAVKGYRSMGDDDNAKLAERLRNDIKNDYDEMLFVYDKIRTL